jgi:hypothetical protein
MWTPDLFTAIANKNLVPHLRRILLRPQRPQHHLQLQPQGTLEMPRKMTEGRKMMEKMLQTLRDWLKLISAAEADDEDDSDNKSETTTPAPQNSSSMTHLTQYLKENPYPGAELGFYWKGGIAKLEETLAAYELLSESPRRSDNEVA